jgi:hypothetical protein
VIPLQRVVSVACLAAALSSATASVASAQVPPLDPVPVASEPVAAVQQPDTSVLPVFDAAFAAPGAPFGARIHSDVSGDYAAYTSVTTGGGEVFVSSEARADVTVFDGASLVFKRRIADPALIAPRGVAFYRGELFVVDAKSPYILVFDAATGVLKRRLPHPAEFLARDESVLGPLTMSGIDVAWG